MDSNAGVMFRQQTEPRGGGQAEGSDGDLRAEAESKSRNHHDLFLLLLCRRYENLFETAPAFL